MYRTCEFCGMPLDGAEYIMPWEDGDNYYGYWICPFCGKETEDDSDDD